MADFSYTPKFHHVEWIDNVDRCEAGGSNGFNIRFDTIESDLHGVSTVVGQIGADIDTLNARVPPKPPTITLSVAPLLQPVAGSTAWLIQPSGAAVAPTTGGPSGVLPLNLPDHAQVTSIRVIGFGTPPAGQNTSFAFSRISLTDNSVQNINYDTSTVPLGSAKDVSASANALIDLANFRYVFTASSGTGTGQPVTLVTFQFTYNNP